MLDRGRRLSAGTPPGSVNADLFHYFIPGTDLVGLKQFSQDLSKMLGKLGLGGTEDSVVYEQKFGMRACPGCLDAPIGRDQECRDSRGRV